MAKAEIKNLLRSSSGRLLPSGLNIWQQLWWRFVPGVVINVRWPSGSIIKDFADQYKSNTDLLSADPNDHYRPWLEKHIGKQGRDWNWGLTGYDVSVNRLTIKVRQKYAKFASIAAIQWG